MPTNIKCPKFTFEFPIEYAVSEEYKKELREQMMHFKKQKEEELYKKEQEWKQQLQQQERELLLKNDLEKKQLQKDLEENLRKKIIGDFENQLTLLQQNNAETEEKLKEALERNLTGDRALTNLLSDQTLAANADLPSTGVPPELERNLSAMFIKIPGYGTRCTTVIKIIKDGWTSFAETVYDNEGKPTGETNFTIEGE